eukprot:3240786-Alexandrium_andersonii.AAC.1
MEVDADASREAASPAARTPARAAAPRDVRQFVSPDRTLDFTPSQRGAPVSLGSLQGAVSGSPSPLPAGSLVDPLDEDE